MAAAALLALLLSPALGAAPGAASVPASASAPASAPATPPLPAIAPAMSPAMAPAVLVPGPAGSTAAAWVAAVFTDPAADAPGVLAVRRIELREAAAGGRVRQVLDGLATDTPWTPEAPGLQWLDMNFDGHPDLRIIESRPAGPNLPYLNWLYDPAQQRFVASPALDAITAPVFDAKRRVVASHWRDGAAREGTDVHAWVDGALMPQRRETIDRDRRGRAWHRQWVWSGTDWRPAPAAPRRRQ